jgi:hypothetical protein
MRLISIVAVAAVSAPLLGGCFGPDDSKKPWMAHSQKCEQLGFKRGTPEDTKCRFELARHAGAHRLHQTERPIPSTAAAKFGWLLGQAGRQKPWPLSIRCGKRAGVREANG